MHGATQIYIQIKCMYMYMVASCVNIRAYNCAYAHCAVARVPRGGRFRVAQVQRDTHVHVHVYADVGA